MKSIKKSNSNIFPLVYPEEILSISDKIRIKSASESRERLLLKDNITRRSADNYQTQEAFDHTSKSDFPRNTSKNNECFIMPMEITKPRINSAYSGYSVSKENPTCWRNIVKSDSLIAYHNPADRITASEMCQFVGKNCKLCSAKGRHLSNSCDSKMTIIHNNNPTLSNRNPFQRIISSGKPLNMENSDFRQTLSQLPSTKYFFLDLHDLKIKLFKSPKLDEYYSEPKKRWKSSILYDKNIRNYKNMNKISFNNYKNNTNKLDPPLIPLFQQKKLNNFFINK